MSTGFRKSLFGFNQDDVINYVKKLHNSFAEKEAGFKAQISALESNIAALSLKQEVLEKEKTELNEKLEEYNAKSAEMERLSENIGKLYLVSQSNAKTVMENAEESSKITTEEISRNVSAIEETHSALDTLRKNIAETSENFNKEIAALMQSLEVTKARITDSAVESSNATNEFAELLKAVSK